MDVDIGIRKDLQPQYTGEEIAVFLILNYLQNDKTDNLFISVTVNSSNNIYKETQYVKSVCS